MSLIQQKVFFSYEDAQFSFYLMWNKVQQVTRQHLFFVSFRLSVKRWFMWGVSRIKQTNTLLLTANRSLWLESNLQIMTCPNCRKRRRNYNSAFYSETQNHQVEMHPVHWNTSSRQTDKQSTYFGQNFYWSQEKWQRRPLFFFCHFITEITKIFTQCLSNIVQMKTRPQTWNVILKHF